MRIVISEPETGKAYQAEIPKDKESLIVGKRMGETLDGGAFGAAGYEFELTGGSDGTGFPMRKDVPGVRKDQLLLSDGPGFNPSRKGERQKKFVRGNTYSADIIQVNAKVSKKGATPLETLFPKAAAEPKK